MLSIYSCAHEGVATNTTTEKLQSGSTRWRKRRCANLDAKLGWAKGWDFRLRLKRRKQTPVMRKKLFCHHVTMHHSLRGSWHVESGTFNFQSSSSRCNGSTTVEYKTCDFRSASDRSATSDLHILLPCFVWCCPLLGDGWREELSHEERWERTLSFLLKNL